MANDKTVDIIKQLLQLRLAVGFLGQKGQGGWWGCNFLDSTGLRFLEMTFPRTAHLAALRSTTEAACITHDKALGRVGNFHLFRLPPAMEDQLEHISETLDWPEQFKLLESSDTALLFLKTTADALIHAPEGPVQVGVERRILTSTSVQEFAAHYHSAFADGKHCYPYFGPDK
jgi:hypothetical protein